MGRGRAKAKQTKVARELKYSSPDMNLDRLRQDLGTGGQPNPVDEIEVEDYDDPYAVDDEGEGARRRR
ncbi:MAG TPA: DUF3073 domain-containing protein [Frankiaceae bacterium]|nr:DUF3073 domain-containing protein [Frankiaceae bacterium]